MTLNRRNMIFNFMIALKNSNLYHLKYMYVKYQIRLPHLYLNMYAGINLKNNNPISWLY